MKRVVVLLLVTLLLGSMVFARGGRESGTTIEYINTFDPAYAGGYEGRHHQEKYSEYEMANPGMTIVHNIMNYDQIRERTIISGQARTGADFIHMLGEWVPEFVQMGLLSDITDDIRSWSDYRAFPESAWRVATINDRIYGIPSISSTRVLLYREDLLRNAGVSVPRTWTELREAARRLTRDGVYGFAFCSSTRAIRGPQEFAIFLYSVDRAELAMFRNGRWVPGFTVDQVEQVFQLYYDMMFVDQSVPPFSIGWEWEELDPAFSTGTVAMTSNGAWMRGRIGGGVSGEHWRTAPLPYHTNPSTYLEVKVEGVSSFTRNRQAVIDFGKWLYTRDNMAYLFQYDNLPSRSDAPQSMHWIDDPVWKGTFLQTVGDGFSFPPIPLAPVLEATMVNLQEVLFQRMTPRESAQDFFNKVRNYLDTEIN